MPSSPEVKLVCGSCWSEHGHGPIDTRHDRYHEEGAFAAVPVVRLDQLPESVLEALRAEECDLNVFGRE